MAPRVDKDDLKIPYTIEEQQQVQDLQRQITDANIQITAELIRISRMNRLIEQEEQETQGPEEQEEQEEQDLESQWANYIAEGGQPIIISLSRV